MKVIRTQCVPGSNRVASCGHTVGLNGVLWVYGFMGARWNWCGINNINLSQARRRSGGRGNHKARNIVEGFAKKTRKTLCPFVRTKLAFLASIGAHRINLAQIRSELSF